MENAYMKTFVALIIFSCVVVLGSASSAPIEQQATLSFPLAGFSLPLIDFPPDLQVDEQQYYLILFLPIPDPEFKSNINVIVERSELKLEEFGERSHLSNSLIGNELLMETSEGNVFYAEYIGPSPYQDATLHYYTKTILANGYFYTATATVREEYWEEFSDDIRDILGAFELYLE
jgi:hypothetical protein